MSQTPASDHLIIRCYLPSAVPKFIEWILHADSQQTETQTEPGDLCTSDKGGGAYSDTKQPSCIAHAPWTGAGLGLKLGPCSPLIYRDSNHTVILDHE